MTESAEQSSVLRFWFGAPPGQPPSYAQQRSLWFRKSDETDQQIRAQFETLHKRVAAGKYQHWATTSRGLLALIVVLDQFSRNMFRNTPRAFATDPQALELATSAIAQGIDQSLFPAERLFVYLPLEHSEDIQSQVRSVEKFKALATDDSDLDDTYDYALKHKAVIERFGRFPHRNDILGRESTPEEKEFLKQPGSSF